MDVLSDVSLDSLFVNPMQTQAQLNGLSQQMLSNGIDLYQKKKYEEAAAEFKKSINLSPSSPYTADASRYLAYSYQKLNETDKAIEAYQRGIELNRDDDSLQIDLGNLYFSQDRYADAVDAYREAVRINPSSSGNRYSLGQGLLKMERYSDAEAEFRAVIRMEPDSAVGYYGMGQTLSRREQFEKSIDYFEKTLKKDGEFYDARAEIGYAYADLGDIDRAREVVEALRGKDDLLAESLYLYVEKVDPPRIEWAWGTSTFTYGSSINTPVSALDAYLVNAGAEKTMSMKFLFSKDMDRGSVENIANWSIQRSHAFGAGGAYNFGLEIPETEITLDFLPDNVYYDADSRSATVYFTVRQNDTADGTIDPSHIVFKFSGQDREGIAIDPEHDEFSGFSGVA
jgi:TolA-binding protein